MKFSHILVPTDFSESSEAALDYAVTLRGKFSTEITLLHVVEPFYGYGVEIIPAFDVEANRHASAEKHLKEVAATIEGHSRVKSVCLSGKPWHCICEWAADNDVDLIVMPTHGHSGLLHMWLGSVAERVVQKAPCPVLVVRGIE